MTFPPKKHRDDVPIRLPEPPVYHICPACATRYDEGKDWICPGCRYGEWVPERKES